MKTYSKRPGSGESRYRVNCVVCGADCPRKHWECGEYSFVRCCRCGHVYQDPQPAPADLLARYDIEYSDYEVENDRNFLDLMLKGLDDVSFFEQVTARRVPRTLLDIGCATGTLLQHVRDQGWEVQGVEVCEPAARYGVEQRGVPIAVGTLETVDLNTRRFGAVHFSHVIEHVPDPRAFLLAVRDHLLPDGLGVVVTPNTSGLQARIFGPRWRSAIADHVHLFSARNLVRLLRESGFDVLAIQTWGGLGVGTAPRWIKSPVDRLAKSLGFGDVVLALFTPAAGSEPRRAGDFPATDHS